MLDQSAERLLEMIRGYWVSQIVGTLAKLGIPDRLGSSPVLSANSPSASTASRNRLIACFVPLRVSASYLAHEPIALLSLLWDHYCDRMCPGHCATGRSH
jgi:hypothetical protein